MNITHCIDYCDNGEWKEEIVTYQTTDLEDALNDADRFEHHYEIAYGKAEVTTYVS